MDPTSPLRHLTVFSVNHNKCRIGKQNDGGYVINELPGGYDCLISGGISNDISFEEGFLAKYGSIPCYAFDGTIAGLPKVSPGITFIRKNLGSENTEHLTDLSEYIAPFHNIFLKIDIEGHEFSVLPHILERFAGRIKQIAIEFHSPMIFGRYPNYFKGLLDVPQTALYAVLEQLTATHTLTHIHGNNGSGSGMIDGVFYPYVFECTYVRNDFAAEKKRNTIACPGPLDMPNVGGPEFVLVGPPYTVEGALPPPPRAIPSNEYSMNGQMAVLNWYFDSRVEAFTNVWSTDYIDGFLRRFTPENIRRGTHGTETYGGAAALHLAACEKYRSAIEGKRIAVIGSETPWIEALLINMGATSVTTVEYNCPDCSHDKIRTVTYDAFCELPAEQFDAIFSYSSIEHSGLGRYGDPLDPWGDLKTVHQMRRTLCRGGLLFLGVPIGKDALVWNAHRIYGPLRLEHILREGGFRDLDWFGTQKAVLFARPSGYYEEPLMVWT